MGAVVVPGCMDTCPRCDRGVDRLHFVPPGVVTRGLLERLGDPEATTRVEVCRDCVHELLEDGAAV